MPKLTPKNLLAMLALLVALGSAALAQRPEGSPAPMSPAPGVRSPQTPPPADPRPKINVNTSPPVNWRHNTMGTYERAIATDANVTLSMCVVRGKLTVNSWERNEVRVFLDGGNKFGFTVKEKNTRSGQPAWVAVNPVSEAAGGPPPPTDCLIANEIEIDVPTGTTLDLKGEQVTLVADSLKRVKLKSTGGGTQLRNISEGINAIVNNGNISVEDSSGSISLDTTNGNILVYEASPSQVGDTFRAKTFGGSISLQHIGHRQVDVSTISGAVTYDGPILDGGGYKFTTNSGSLRLLVPTDAKFQLVTTYGGTFTIDLPIKVQTENVEQGPIKRVVGRVGDGGDATVTLTSPSGSVSIRKLP